MADRSDNTPMPDGMRGSLRSRRYEDWYAEEKGAFALEKSRELLRHLFSGWPRRSRSALVFNAGSGHFLETLWESGFDVTGQDSEPEFLALARQRLGTRADYVLSSPEHLPFDDCSFDYAVAAAAFEFWTDPAAVLAEIGRVACGGFVMLFPNRYSLFSLECRLRRKNPLCADVRLLLQSPRKISGLLRAAFGKRKINWVSLLPGPSPLWKEHRFLNSLNSLPLPLPLGAFAGLRIDFGPICTSTPLVLRAGEPMPTLK